MPGQCRQMPIGHSIPAVGSGGVVEGMRRARAEGAGARWGPPDAWRGRITAGSARKPRPRMGQRVVGGFRRTDRAGGGSAWRGSVGGPDRLGGGRFVDELPNCRSLT
jgi:hypothetical protein